MKPIKTLLHRILFHPFGYDLVPLKDDAHTPRRKPAAEVNLARYESLYGDETVRK